jgi:hypothetical protein
MKTFPLYPSPVSIIWIFNNFIFIYYRDNVGEKFCLSVANKAEIFLPCSLFAFYILPLFFPIQKPFFIVSSTQTWIMRSFSGISWGVICEVSLDPSIFLCFRTIWMKLFTFVCEFLLPTDSRLIVGRVHLEKMQLCFVNTFWTSLH